MISLTLLRLHESATYLYRPLFCNPRYTSDSNPSNPAIPSHSRCHPSSIRHPHSRNQRHRHRKRAATEGGQHPLVSPHLGVQGRHKTEIRDPVGSTNHSRWGKDRARGLRRRTYRRHRIPGGGQGVQQGRLPIVTHCHNLCYIPKKDFLLVTLCCRTARPLAHYPRAQNRPFRHPWGLGQVSWPSLPGKWVRGTAHPYSQNRKFSGQGEYFFMVKKRCFGVFWTECEGADLKQRKGITTMDHRETRSDR